MANRDDYEILDDYDDLNEEKGEELTAEEETPDIDLEDKNTGMSAIFKGLNQSRLDAIKAWGERREQAAADKKAGKLKDKIAAMMHDEEVVAYDNGQYEVYIPGIGTQTGELPTELNKEDYTAVKNFVLADLYEQYKDQDALPLMRFNDLALYDDMKKHMEALGVRLDEVQEDAWLHGGGYAEKFMDFMKKFPADKNYAKEMDKIMSPEARASLLDRKIEITANGRLITKAMKDLPDYLANEIVILEKKTQTDANLEELHDLKIVEKEVRRWVDMAKDPRNDSAKFLDRSTLAMKGLAKASIGTLIAGAAGGLGYLGYWGGKQALATPEVVAAKSATGGFFTSSSSTVATGSMIGAAGIPIIGWAVIGMAALAVIGYGVYKAYKNWDTIKPKLDAAGTKAWEAFAYVGNGAKNYLVAFKDGVVRQAKAVNATQAKYRMLTEILDYAPKERNDSKLSDQEALNLSERLENALVLSEVYECLDARPNDVNVEHMKSIIALKVQGLRGSEIVKSSPVQFENVRAYAGPKGYDDYEQKVIIPKVKAKIEELIGREPRFLKSPSGKESIAHLHDEDKEALFKASDELLKGLKDDLSKAQAEVVSAVREQFKKGKKHHMSQKTHEHAVEIVQQADTVIDTIREDLDARGPTIGERFDKLKGEFRAGVSEKLTAIRQAVVGLTRDEALERLSAAQSTYDKLNSQHYDLEEERDTHDPESAEYKDLDKKCDALIVKLQATEAIIKQLEAQSTTATLSERLTASSEASARVFDEMAEKLNEYMETHPFPETLYTKKEGYDEWRVVNDSDKRASFSFQEGAGVRSAYRALGDSDDSSVEDGYASHLKEKDDHGATPESVSIFTKLKRAVGLVKEDSTEQTLEEKIEKAKKRLGDAEAARDLVDSKSRTESVSLVKFEELEQNVRDAQAELDELEQQRRDQGYDDSVSL